MSSAPLLDRWRSAWPQALAAWSKFTRLSDPRLCESRLLASQEGLSGSFAMIRLSDQSVVVDLETVAQMGLDDYGVEVLAHEIGHHVLAPASATDHYRLVARIRRALPTLERYSAIVANLFTDLLINDRLQRRAGLRMADIYRLLNSSTGQPSAKARTGTISESKPANAGLWVLYMGIYEQLWQLEKGSLGGPRGDSRTETDAWLGARLIRAYADDWLDAGGRFATLLLPYLVEDDEASKRALERLHDTKDAAAGCEPQGLTDVEDGEAGGSVHPSEDPRITGEDEDGTAEGKAPAEAAASAGGSRGQRREPWEYGEILKASGLNLSDHAMAVRYYREAALPQLVPFPSRPTPEAHEPLLEGLEPWDLGDPLDEIDWIETVTRSPRIFPGVTTMRRMYGRVEGQNVERVPVDLDLYVDCSGSMPNPQQRISYLALAGAVIVLSALRTGSRVQATLWSGKHQMLSTPGFVRDENAILEVLTGYLGGATAFPIHKLRETFAQREREPSARPCHILMISDDGITTMFDVDERGNSGWAVAAHALEVGKAGGTMALNLPAQWEQSRASNWWNPDILKRARNEQHWDIYALTRMEDLVEFARSFSREHYAERRPERQAVLTP
jgi:hypothetical protein